MSIRGTYLINRVLYYILYYIIYYTLKESNP
jgi:hypothetical protein